MGVRSLPEGLRTIACLQIPSRTRHKYPMPYWWVINSTSVSSMERARSELTSWELRVANALKERPACCPECGSDRVTHDFCCRPTPEAVKAVEPYGELFYFGYNHGCCPPRRNSPRESELWFCRQCRAIWGEVFHPMQKPSTSSRESDVPDCLATDDELRQRAATQPGEGLAGGNQGSEYPTEGQIGRWPRSR